MEAPFTARESTSPEPENNDTGSPPSSGALATTPALVPQNSSVELHAIAVGSCALSVTGAPPDRGADTRTVESPPPADAIQQAREVAVMRALGLPCPFA